MALEFYKRKEVLGWQNRIMGVGGRLRGSNFVVRLFIYPSINKLIITYLYAFIYLLMHTTG